MLEAIMNFVKARACRVNNYEILSIAVQVRKLVVAVFPEMAPFLGPPCWTTGICYEGDRFFKDCNKPWKSPCVLMTPDFPKQINMVNVRGQTYMIDGETNPGDNGE